MSNQENIQNEWENGQNKLPPNSRQPFSVPEGYFDGLAASILAKVKGVENDVQVELQDISPLVAGLPKSMPYSIPIHYFEENVKFVADYAAEPDLSFLNAVGRQLPYQVPQGYFQNLAEEVTQKLAQPKAKVVPLFARKWMRMAAAAGIGGALFVGGYQYLNQPSPAIDTAENGSTDSVQQLAANTPAIKQEIKKVTTKELEDFIQTVPVIVKETEKPKTTTAEKKAVKELLKDVSDSEVETFLSSIPATDDDFLGTD